MEIHPTRSPRAPPPSRAINKRMSGTRREELLLTEDELRKVWVLRKSLEQLDTVAITELILDRLRKTANNPAFLKSIVKSADEDTQWLPAVLMRWSEWSPAR